MELVSITLYPISCAALMHVSLGSSLVRLSGSFSGTIHSPVFVHFAHCMTILPQYLMVQPILVNVTSHLALHKCTTDNSDSEWCANPGMMWASLAFGERSGNANVHVSVDLM